MSEKIEIKQTGDNEYWIGTNKTVLIDQKIIRITAVGEQTSEMASLHKELDHKLFNSVEGQLNYLVDVNKCGKNSQEASAMYRQLCYNEKVNKVAVFGLHPVARIIASFVIGLDPKGKQRFFKSEEQAIIWLNE